MNSQLASLLNDLQAVGIAAGNRDSIECNVNTDELIARLVNVYYNCNLDDTQRHQVYHLVSSLGGISPEHGDPFLACLEDMSLEEDPNRIEPEIVIVPDEPKSIWENIKNIVGKFSRGDLCL
jgi:hypothetical protein